MLALVVSDVKFTGVVDVPTVVIGSVGVTFPDVPSPAALTATAVTDITKKIIITLTLPQIGNTFYQYQLS